MHKNDYRIFDGFYMFAASIDDPVTISGFGCMRRSAMARAIL